MRLQLMLSLAITELPNDCMDILHHTKNVRNGVITNQTEEKLHNLFTAALSLCGEYGQPSTIEWSHTDSGRVMFEVRWL